MSLRISRSVSRNAINYYIIEDIVTREGKKTTATVESLGSLSRLMEEYDTDRDGVEAILRERLNEIKKQYALENQPVRLELHQDVRIDKNVQALFNGGYLFIQKVFYELGLDRIAEKINSEYRNEYSLTDVLSGLVCMRILDPCSKKAALESAGSLIEPPSYKLHDIYRALSVLYDHMDDIQAQLYRNSRKIMDRNTGILFYDCTNYFFEAEEEDGFRMYGVSKEHRPNPIVQMGLFMDGSGIPLAFSIFPGNQSEQPSLKPLEKKLIRDFELSKFIVCTDAGLASASNRRFNSIGNRAFITTQSIKKLNKEYKSWALDPKGWHRFKDEDKTKVYDLSELDDDAKNPANDVTFYKEGPYTDAQGTEQTMIVTYSPKYRAYQKRVRDRQIERAVKIIEKGSIPKKKNANDVKRFIEDIHYTEDGEVADSQTLTLNQEVIDEEERYDGFYAVCTNLDDDPLTTVKACHGRWEIEESFEILKSEFNARPVYLSKKERITAHFLVCFISLLIYRIIEKKHLQEKYSAPKIIKTLRDMQFHYYSGKGYIPVYKRTDITDALHESFGFNTDYQIISEKNMKKIIRQTKKR